MKIFDISPGYLSNDMLVREHDAIHAVLSAGSEPVAEAGLGAEQQRWKGCLGNLAVRHNITIAEMALRNLPHDADLDIDESQQNWPTDFQMAPGEQFGLLSSDNSEARIPVPRTVEALWQQHSLSVAARSPILSKAIANAAENDKISFGELALLLTTTLRSAPSAGRIENVVQQMWQLAAATDGNAVDPHRAGALEQLQKIVVANSIATLLETTALGEFAWWIQHSA
jgi:hypothetical protein